jgi:hypothetical protein
VVADSSLISGISATQARDRVSILLTDGYMFLNTSEQYLRAGEEEALPRLEC